MPRRKNKYFCSSLDYTGGSQTQVATQIRITQGLKTGRDRVLCRIRFLYLTSKCTSYLKIYFWHVMCIYYSPKILDLTNIINFFYLAQQPPVGHGLLIHEVFISHSTTHHSRLDSPGRVISPSQRLLPDNTQHSPQTDIHVPRRDSNPQSQQTSGRRLTP